MHPLKPWLALLKQEAPRLWMGSVLLLLTLLSALGLLGLSGWFITATGVTALAWAAGTAIALDIYTPGGGIRFFALARTVTRYLERVYNHDTVLRLLARLRQQLFAGMTRTDPMTLARWRASQWVNRLITDVETLDNLYLRLLAPPLVAAAVSALLVAVLAIFSPAAALLAGLVLLLLLACATFGMALAGRNLSARLAALQEQERSQLIEHLQALGELQASHSLTTHQQQRLAAQEQLIRNQARLQQLIAWGQSLQTLLLQLVVAGVLVLLAAAYQQDAISAPVLVMLPLAIMALQEAYQALPMAFANWGGTLAAATRLNRATGLQQQPKHQSDAALLPSVQSQSLLQNWRTLEFSRICLSYQQQTVLDDFSLTLNRGESVAILAASGSGKSTLAALMAGQLQPSQGRITLQSADQKENFNLTQLPDSLWLQQLGYLTQQTGLFATSIAENLRLAKPDARDDELWQVLEQVELANEVRHFEDQLETWVGETGRQLSGGQARRLAIARILLKDAPLVILDEPFRGVDQTTREIIRPRLEQWLQGRTALLLGHQQDQLPKADRNLSL